MLFWHNVVLLADLTNWKFVKFVCNWSTCGDVYCAKNRTCIIRQLEGNWQHCTTLPRNCIVNFGPQAFVAVTSDWNNKCCFNHALPYFGCLYFLYSFEVVMRTHCAYPKPLSSKFSGVFLWQISHPLDNWCYEVLATWHIQCGYLNSLSPLQNSDSWFHNPYFKIGCSLRAVFFASEPLGCQPSFLTLNSMHSLLVGCPRRNNMHCVWSFHTHSGAAQKWGPDLIIQSLGKPKKHCKGASLSETKASTISRDGHSSMSYWNFSVLWQSLRLKLFRPKLRHVWARNVHALDKPGRWLVDAHHIPLIHVRLLLSFLESPRLRWKLAVLIK